MATMSELYQTVILDHNRAPRNYRAMPEANRQAEGFNPLCGDKVHVWLKVAEDGRIEDVSFQGEGCAISKASSSIMTQTVKGRTVDEARALFAEFHDVVTGKTSGEGHGKMAVFAGVSSFPMRVKCASLGWHALKAALERPDAVVSTE
ncbi:MAG: Fe-S cluster assembly sulfur transfer protein SufU [Gemmatimonadota bacterium]